MALIETRQRLVFSIHLLFCLLSCCFILLVSSSTVQPQCSFPRKFEGWRFEANYDYMADQFLAVDCDLQRMYGRARNNPPDIFTITDLATERIYVFTPGSCIWVTLEDLIIPVRDECKLPADAQSTGEITLASKLLQGFWSIREPFSYEQTEVVIKHQNKNGECLPFISRLQSGQSIIRGSIFYEINSGISDPTLLDANISDCVEFKQPAKNKNVSNHDLF
ncbi:hypothetical protein PoB_002281900 [Plakobranchus ocellatus]|uniref:Uncharacterized protein n=1 Tax=Plakobranchus ocellatus TaxID=259542 RepID=A0AAV3ZLW7_9GAST|nr:hypothetical protein PoB_002281900 [Plakobranchus ocellatus]